MPIKHPIVAAAVTPTDSGYWFTDSTGLVSNFGSADYFGSAPSPLFRPIVGMAEAPGSTGFFGGSFPSGSYGFDISNFQCSGGFPTGAHAIGIVQVDGSSSGAANKCLAQEAAWAGGGLNLYTFLNYETSSTNEPGCNGDQACNAGYQAGDHAYQDAVNAGLNAGVPWWLDVENNPISAWSSDTGENALFVQGAMNALARDERCRRCRHLRQPGQLQRHRRELHPVGPLLDGRLSQHTERTGLVRRLQQLGGQGEAVPGPAANRAVQQRAVRRGLRLLARRCGLAAVRPRPYSLGFSQTDTCCGLSLVNG